MTEFSDKLARIEAKIQKLIEENNSLKEGKANLLDQNKQLSSRLEKQQDALKSMEQELQVSEKDTNGSANFGKSNKHLKEQLDKYTKEIDKCIEWLSNS